MVDGFNDHGIILTARTRGEYAKFNRLSVPGLSWAPVLSRQVENAREQASISCFNSVHDGIARLARSLTLGVRVA